MATLTGHISVIHILHMRLNFACLIFVDYENILAVKISRFTVAGSFRWTES